MQFIERVNIDTLKYIIENVPAEQLGTYYSKGAKESDYESVKTFVTNYYESLSGKGYKTVDYAQKDGRGRHWPQSSSITNLSKPIRHLIADEYNIDLDMVNCHPVLLQDYCTRNNIPCRQLSRYVTSRNEILSNFEGQDIKTEVLRLINGGKAKLDNGFVRRFTQEIKNIHSSVIDLNSERFEQLKKTASYNPEGRLMSDILCDLENQCLEAMIRYCKENKIRVTSLAFDGLTIDRSYKNEQKLDSIIKGMQAQILCDCDILMSIKHKPMNQGLDIYEDDDDEEEEECDEPEECSCEFDHSKLNAFLAEIVTHFKIKPLDDKYKNWFKFIKNVSCDVCEESFISKLPAVHEDISYDPSIEEINSFDWKWAKTVTPPRKRSFQAHVEIINEQLRLIEIASEEIQCEDEYDLSNSEIKFSSDDQFTDMMKHLHNTVFETLSDLRKYIIEQGPRYFRSVNNPQCFIINKGLQGTEIVKQLNRIKGFYYHKQADKPKELKSIYIYNTNGRSLLNDNIVFQNTQLYGSFGFNPNEEKQDPNEFNTWKGFKSEMVDEVDMSKVTPFLKHIKEAWCNDNEDHYDYCVQWLKHVFTKPWIKTGVVPVLYGVEGTGKGILIDELLNKYIFGSYGSTHVGISKLVGRFNACIMDKVFIACNEVCQEVGSFHNAFDNLKALITDTSIPIERKGLPVLQDYRNYCNYIFTTNNHDAVRISGSDRRFFVLETSNRYKGNFEYFNKLAELCDQEAADHFFTYICNLPTTRNIRSIPETDIKNDMRDVNKSTVEKFKDDLIEAYNRSKASERNKSFDNVEGIMMSDWDSLLLRKLTNGKIKLPVCYNLYKSWCNDSGERSKTKRKFSREMGDLLSVGVLDGYKCFILGQ